MQTDFIGSVEWAPDVRATKEAPNGFAPVGRRLLGGAARISLLTRQSKEYPWSGRPVRIRDGFPPRNRSDSALSGSREGRLSHRGIVLLDGPVHERTDIQRRPPAVAGTNRSPGRPWRTTG